MLFSHPFIYVSIFIFSLEINVAQQARNPCNALVLALLYENYGKMLRICYILKLSKKQFESFPKHRFSWVEIFAIVPYK